MSEPTTIVLLDGESWDFLQVAKAFAERVGYRFEQSVNDDGLFEERMYRPNGELAAIARKRVVTVTHASDDPH